MAEATAERSLLQGLTHYLSILLAYRWLIAITALTAAAAAVAFAVLSRALPPARSPLPNTYRASSVLLLQQEEAASVEATLASVGLVAPGAAGLLPGQFDYAQLAMKVMRSREFVDTLLEDFNLYGQLGIPRSSRTQARQLIMSGSSFDYDKTTRTLTIGYSHIDPVFARDIVARMVELLNEWFLTRGGTNKLRQKTLLEEKLAQVSADITRLEDQVKAFQETYGVLRVEDLAASQSQVLDGLRSQLRLKESDIQNYSQFVKIVDPTLIMMRSERDNLLEQIRKIESGFTNPSGTIMPAKQNLPDLAQRFGHLTAALRIQRNIFEALSQQYELTKLSLESQPVFTVLEAAEAPDTKSGPSRGRICATATLLAALGSMLVAFSLNAARSFLREPGRLRRLAGKI